MNQINKDLLKSMKFAIATTFMIAALLFMTYRITNAGFSEGGGSGTPEGTAVLSTGEAGGTKYLREDGDNTCSWQTPAGSGDLLANGTVPLTADWDVGNFGITGRDLIADFGVAAATANITGLATVGTIQTGQGATEVYGMDQAVKTTNMVTFDKITSTTDVTAASMTLTGAGLSSVNAGLVVNEDGGASVTTDLFRVETNTEAYMINTSADADTMTLGGITNGIQINKGGKVTSLGTAIGLAWSGSPKDFSFTITSPSNTYIVAGSSIPIVNDTPYAITIDSISFSCNANPDTEITGALKYADEPITWANPTTINDIGTTAGIVKDASITSGDVAANKVIFLYFAAQPDSAMKFLTGTIHGHYQ